jgi:hypothetical protein
MFIKPTLAQIWRDSAQRNRESSDYWRQLGHTYLSTLPEMVPFCIRMALETEQFAILDELLAAELEHDPK